MNREKQFGAVTPEIAEELKAICGKRSVIYQEPEKLEAYSHDEVAEPAYFVSPDCVVKPSCTDEVSRVMAVATRYRLPVTPRGAGSGLSGGCIPVKGGIVLSLERMNRILDIDYENLMITVEPGVVTNAINEAVKGRGLWFAGYPMSLESCFIGGNVAENAGGGKAIKYGVTSRYITGLQIVLPSGEILSLGGKLRKNVTGYDLISLICGSEGTLAVVTEITLALMPLPPAKAALLALFPDTASAIQTVPRLLSEGRIIPTSIEYMDQLSFRTVCRYLNESLPYSDAGAMLLIEVDGRSDDEVAGDYGILGELCEEQGASQVYVADNTTTIDRVWSIRRNIAEAFKVDTLHQSLEDIVVPTARIPEFMDGLETLSRESALLCPCYGHAGDGNLHVTVIKPSAWSVEEWHRCLPEFLQQVYRLCASCGGVISGEHGIGSKRRDSLGINLAPETVALMKRVKTAFDPDGILNPGKIFPDTQGRD